VTVKAYDALGQLVTTVTNYTGSGVFDPELPDENLTRVTVYDGAGQQVATVELRGEPATAITTTYAYDRLGRVLTTTMPLTGTEVAISSWRYDGLGRVITETDALGRARRTDYDRFDRPITLTVNYVDGAFNPAVTDEDLRTVSAYDAAGNRLSVRAHPQVVVTAVKSSNPGSSPRMLGGVYRPCDRHFTGQ
jgi:YD repeat-containing protein